MPSCRPRTAFTTASGKAILSCLPAARVRQVLEQGERITTIMPLPEDEEIWESYDVMFATTRGTVRRNKLSDFVDVRRNGRVVEPEARGQQPSGECGGGGIPALVVAVQRAVQAPQHRPLQPAQDLLRLARRL